MTPAPIRIRYGARQTALQPGKGTALLEIACPLLAGPNEEILLADPCPLGDLHGFAVFHSREMRCGLAVFPFEGDLVDVSNQAYRALFRSLGDDNHLYRVWHFVPQINAIENGMERYRLFCQGRAQAFAEHFSDAAESRMSAASAVGVSGNRLAIYYLGGPTPPKHLENPDQIPAYRYPERYGPKPPSFSRATLLDAGAVNATAFLAGTASIKGHESMHIGDVKKQTATTLYNMRLLFRTMGHEAEDGLASFGCAKIYLRHPGDEDFVMAAMREEFPCLGDRITTIQADICRRELDVEIEIFAEIAKRAAPALP